MLVSNRTPNSEFPLPSLLQIQSSSPAGLRWVTLSQHGEASEWGRNWMNIHSPSGSQTRQCKIPLFSSMIFLFKRQFVMDFPPSHVWWQQRVPSFTGAIFMRGRQKGRATLRSPTSCIPNWSPGALSVRGSFGWRKSTLLEQKFLWKSPWNCWNFRISLNQDLANGMGYPVWSGGAGPLSVVMPGFSLEVSVGEMYGSNHENRWN